MQEKVKKCSSLFLYFLFWFVFLTFLKKMLLRKLLKDTLKLSVGFLSL